LHFFGRAAFEGMGSLWLWLLTILPCAVTSSKITVDLSKLLAHTSDQFLGINIDAYEMLGVPSCAQNLPFEHPNIVALGSLFRGATIRVGGSWGDNFYYRINGTAPGLSTDAATDTTLTQRCALDAGSGNRTWDKLYHFAKTNGLKIVYGLNALGNRFQNNSWDPEPTHALLQYIHQNGDDAEGVLQGLEFGNEPFEWNVAKYHPLHVTAKQLATQYPVLKSIMQSLGMNSSVLLQGPDSATAPFDTVYVNDFLSGIAAQASPHDQARGNDGVDGTDSSDAFVPLDQFSVHLYSTSGCHPDNCVLSNFLAPSKVIHETVYLKNYQDSLHRHLGASRASQAAVPIVLSETAAASCGGCANVSDVFGGTLWFLVARAHKQTCSANYLNSQT
jgi:hypothetical protein